MGEKKANMKSNQAFIDGQNMHLGTTRAADPWEVDLARFRVYLKDKYQVEKAYYFLGAYIPAAIDLYDRIRDAGFILMFRDHAGTLTSVKKGNVDTDIVFEIMRKLLKDDTLDKVLLVSGFGDYSRMVKFLAGEGSLLKVLFPSRSSASSLYHALPDSFKDWLDRDGVKKKIGMKKAASS